MRNQALKFSRLFKQSINGTTLVKLRSTCSFTIVRNLDVTSFSNRPMVTVTHTGTGSTSGLGDKKDDAMAIEQDIRMALEEVNECHRRGDYKSGLETALSLKDFVGNFYGEEHPAYASSLSNVGFMHKMLGNYDEAIETYTEALHAYKVIFGTEEHRSYGAVLNNLGLVFNALGSSTTGIEAQNYLLEAEEVFRKVLAIREKILDPDDPQLATTRSNLASVLQKTDRDSEAEILLRETLSRMQTRDKVKGKNNLATATSMNNLAFLLKSKERYDEALNLYEQALELRSELLGPSNSETIIVMHNISELYRAKGEEETARGWNEKILKVMGNTSE